MSHIYGATEAAAAIGCDARALRRFLRSNDSYRNAGMGGRYMFTESELTSLKRAYLKSHAAGVATQHPTAEPSVELDQDKGVDLDEFERASNDPVALSKLRRDRAAARAERQRRLRERIAEVLPERYDDERVVW